MTRETQIKEKLFEMNGANFQLLVEDYLQIKFPATFYNLEPRGRNTNGQSIKGSPDIIGQTTNGSLIIGEISKVDNWFPWIEKDLRFWGNKKKEQNILIDSFYAISLHEFKPDISDDEIKRENIFRIAYEQLGLNEHRIIIIFRNQLIRDLAHPLFAQVVLKHFRLPWNVYPFLSIEDAPTLSPEFAPTKEEFITEKVQVPIDIPPKIKLAIKSNHEAFVFGKPASGKTVLSWYYGFKHIISCRPALYIDCNDIYNSFPSILGQMLSIIETWMNSDLLVIIDNIHLILEKFSVLRLQLKNLQMLKGRIKTEAFSVLYLGRHGGKYTNVNKFIEAKADWRVFQAVFDRIALRHKNMQISLDGNYFKKWVDEFAGDLIAFSVACNEIWKKPNSSIADINSDLALESVRERYLMPLRDDKIAYENFLILCALSSYEIKAPRDVFNNSTPLSFPFGKLDDKAVILGTTLFELPHPQLGGLILRASQKLSNINDLINVACRRYPSLILQVISQNNSIK